MTAWGAEIRDALEGKATQYTAVPSNVEVGWRNTVFGAESIPNNIPYRQVVQEVEEHTAAGIDYSMSTRPTGLRVEIPDEVDPTRLSLLGMNAPISAASSATLFEDFEADFAAGPLAESTPHNTVTQKASRKQPPPPLPLEKNNL